MNVFLAGIIQGSLAGAEIHQQDWRAPIKRSLARHIPAADVYCHHSVHPNSIAYELPEIIATLTDGIEKAGACDLLIAYLPSASMGSAIEIYEASRGGGAIVAITPLSVNWVVRAYSDRIVADLDAFEELADSGELAELVRRKADR